MKSPMAGALWGRRRPRGGEESRSPGVWGSAGGSRSAPDAAFAPGASTPRRRTFAPPGAGVSRWPSMAGPMSPALLRSHAQGGVEPDDLAVEIGVLGDLAGEQGILGGLAEPRREGHDRLEAALSGLGQP